MLQDRAAHSKQKPQAPRDGGVEARERRVGDDSADARLVARIQQRDRRAHTLAQQRQRQFAQIGMRCHPMQRGVEVVALAASESRHAPAAPAVRAEFKHHDRITGIVQKRDIGKHRCPIARVAMTDHDHALRDHGRGILRRDRNVPRGERNAVAGPQADALIRQS